MDSIDHKLIALLKKDAKMTVAQLAAELNRSPTPIYERIKKLEKTGVIRGYTAIIDGVKLGRTLTAFCEVTLKTHEAEHLKAFEAKILELDDVVECHHIAGSFDYLLKILVSDISHYQRFVTEKLTSVPYIARLQSAFALSEIKGTWSAVGGEWAE